MVLAWTVPGSKLIKVSLGTLDKPQNLEECLKLAVSTEFVYSRIYMNGRLRKITKNREG